MIEQINWSRDEFRAWLAAQARDAVVGQANVCEGCPTAMWRKPIDGRVLITADLVEINGHSSGTSEWLEGFVRCLDEAHATESGHLTSYHEEDVTAGECLDILDTIPYHLKPYMPPGEPSLALRSQARDYQPHDRIASEYDWYFDPAFPVHFFEDNNDDRERRAWLDKENIIRTEGWDRPIIYRPDEQYFDSYWGWWNARGALERIDCPIVVMIGPQACESWDGAHRMTIARLAQITSAPVIVGIAKTGSDSV
jgi:hypothetical protein